MIRRLIIDADLIDVCAPVGSTPKCYNSSDPVLSSTSWFVDYIGVFITFNSRDCLGMVGGTAVRRSTLQFSSDTNTVSVPSEFFP